MQGQCDLLQRNFFQDHPVYKKECLFWFLWRPLDYSKGLWDKEVLVWSSVLSCSKFTLFIKLCAFLTKHALTGMKEITFS